MADWAMPLFTVVVAIALFIEMVIIVATYVAIRRLTRRVEGLANYAQNRLPRLISKAQAILEGVQPRISHYILQASAVTHSAREEMERLDRTITERVDHFRVRFVRADEAVTHALDVVEHTGSRTHQVLLAPGESIREFFRGTQKKFTSFLPGSTAGPNEQSIRADLPQQPSA